MINATTQMTSALRICVAAARRLRRKRQAFVVSLVVILLFYVILANDVFLEYKPNAGDGSVELMKMNDPASSTRPGINFDDLSYFETTKSLNSQTSTQSQQTFFDQSPNFNTSKRSKDDDPALLRSGNNSIFSKDRSNISSNWKDRPNISGNTRLGIRENRKSNNGTEQGFQIVVRSQQTGTGNLNSSKGQNAQGPSTVLESDRPMTGMGDNSRSSVLLAGVPRSHKVFLTIGTVTVKRDKADYFFTTVASLLEHSSQADQRDITIVVMLADRNQSHNDHVLEQLKDRYPTELESGLLLVIQGPNSDFIFEKADLKRTYQDSLQRVQWRSKQNIDYAALIDFCTPLSAYYLHIEDDVLSADDYVTHIRDFIKANEKILWAMIEVCPHGFIGKLFKNVDLSKLVIILRSFYLEQPCDFLIGFFMKMMTQNKHILRKGALFFHQGKFSSLFNVTRKTDKLPKIDTLKLPVVKVPRQTGNPAAKVFSDLVSYQDHVVENAYDLMSDKFLWALDVKEGQRYTVVFTKSERLKQLVIETGFSEKSPRDRLDNAAVEMGTRAPEAEGSVVCPEAKTVGTFQKGHLDVTLAPPHDIRCLSVVIKATQKEWLVIREIVVTTG